MTTRCAMSPLLVSHTAKPISGRPTAGAGSGRSDCRPARSVGGDLRDISGCKIGQLQHPVLRAADDPEGNEMHPVTDRTPRLLPREQGHLQLVVSGAAVRLVP